MAEVSTPAVVSDNTNDVEVQPINSETAEAVEVNIEEKTDEVKETEVELTEDKTKKTVEVPKDPKEDPIGWLKQQSSTAVHKVNYHILDWLQKTAITDDAKKQPLPLKGNLELVTRSQLVSFLKDGNILANLVNVFAPGTVETVHEGEALKEKTNQVSNIENFLNFVKEKADIPEDQIFSVDDIQEKGKTGYESIINTLFQLGFKSEEKFNKPGFNLENIIEEVKKVVDPNFLKKLINICNAGFSALTTKLTRSQSSAAVENVEAVVPDVVDENKSIPEEQETKVEVSSPPPAPSAEQVVAQ